MRTIVLICLSDLAPIPLMKISVAYHMSLSPGHDGGLVKPLFWGPHARDGSQVSYKFAKYSLEMFIPGPLIRKFYIIIDLMLFNLCFASQKHWYF